jgi:uncharacterized protein (DUF3820 family)
MTKEEMLKELEAIISTDKMPPGQYDGRRVAKVLKALIEKLP